MIENQQLVMYSVLEQVQFHGPTRKKHVFISSTKAEYMVTTKSTYKVV
jgi:hypothetical protein